ncbi:exodeoxyribonuclease III [Lentilactobacillus parabuchneri]|uniref:exodeoxyribonuclease III n=1 Tax=Lentilactobacillus parabuchneri TaxID=152331 RepID=UPI0026479E7A|nr:exodeoxyribonuclease III [Lentilactobacillus parabuchneri]MDN6435966.1 exodeoxyribonuclease III [Lentilactobacillus parabuchneri]
MKFISWNVNGLRAVVKHDFAETFNQLDADSFCIQETKMQEGQLELELPGYHQYFSYAERKGYSGTAIFTKHEPLNVMYGIQSEAFDHEGRAITLEYPDFYLVTSYVPNSGAGLKRLDFRMGWDTAFQVYLSKLDADKPVILCGDLNVAHKEIDLKNPQSNHHNAGFTDEERQSFTKFLQAGFMDTFRHFYPDQTDIYSWWSYRFHSRDRNAGWRIDYFVTSERLADKITDSKILTDIFGSDHCPVELDTKAI